MRGKLEEMARVVTDSADLVRRVGERLRSVRARWIGGDINRYAAQFQNRHDIVCTLDLDLEGIAPDIEAANVLIHILQEALTNVARHAGASQVTVRCRRDDESLFWRSKMTDTAR